MRTKKSNIHYFDESRGDREAVARYFSIVLVILLVFVLVFFLGIVILPYVFSFSLSASYFLLVLFVCFILSFFWINFLFKRYEKRKLAKRILSAEGVGSSLVFFIALMLAILLAKLEAKLRMIDSGR